MWFEDILGLFLIGAAIFLIGIPFYQLVKQLIPKKRNPMAEAEERLKQARLEVEAAKLNKETEQIYTQMYDDALNSEQERKEQQ